MKNKREDATYRDETGGSNDDSEILLISISPWSLEFGVKKNKNQSCVAWSALDPILATQKAFGSVLGSPAKRFSSGRP